jgi:hypothetical protein
VCAVLGISHPVGTVARYSQCFDAHADWWFALHLRLEVIVQIYILLSSTLPSALLQL